MDKVERSLGLITDVQKELRDACDRLDLSSDSLTGSQEEVTRLQALLNYAKSIRWLTDNRND